MPSAVTGNWPSGKSSPILADMKSVLLALLPLVALIPAASAQNKATARWITESSDFLDGAEIRTVIQMNVNDGWHTYWSNPGEGGLPLDLEAKLPAGWKIGKIQYPAPKRFMTGELPGFGYEGEVLFPVTLNPPAATSGKLPPLTATLSWLTCNDETCIPGKAELSPSDPDADLVAKAYEKLPSSLPGAKLSASISGDSVDIVLVLPEGSEINPAACEVFPVTRNIIDPSARPVFKEEGNAWTCSAPKSEYLDGKIGVLDLVLLGSDEKAWKISTGS